ncbi:MAG: chemotaxis protein CheW [Chitinophagales bacterium]
MSMDMSQYLDVFLEESKEHLGNLNQRLLELEKSPGDIPSLNEIFRAAHTLKGMSSTMGFESMADFTHHMENVLAELKEGNILVNTSVVDTLFQCLDRLQAMVDSIQKGESIHMDNNDIIQVLEKIRTGEYRGQTALAASLDSSLPETVEIEETGVAGGIDSLMVFNDYDLTVIREATERGFGVYFLNVMVDPGCLMKAVRVFMVFKAMEEDGEIIKTDPPAQDLDEGKFENDFNMILITTSNEDVIRKKLDGISEIRTGLIQRLSVQDLEKNAIEMAQQIADARNDQAVNNQSSKTEITTESTRGHRVKQTVRVDIEKLDNLMNLVGELVINKGRLEQIGSIRKVQELNETIEQMERITDDLQNVVMKVRMVPIEQVFNRFPRMVRDLAKDLGKEIEFLIEGKDTELDRTVIDEIGDPLVHLLRNAVDHGIEEPGIRIQQGKNPTGLVKLLARHEGNNVFIEVEDDGMGIDLEIVYKKALEKGILVGKESQNLTDEEVVQLLFESGFSTAENVTDISGRGVGLDVVKNKIESLNGDIVINSIKGKGTTFKIRLPLTLAIIQALLVKVGPEIYAIPLTSVDETTMIEKQDIKMVQSQEVILLRGNVLPLARARTLLEVLESAQDDESMYVVVVRRGGKQLGLIVDALIGQQEIVIKSLGKLLLGVHGIAGATILGDGGVALILDVGTLL